MPKRTPNHRLVKRGRTYTVEEVAVLLGSHRNTVRHWLKNGLKTLDDRRPVLVHGLDLADFLKERRTRSKRPCGAGEIYCLRCRVPRPPAGNVVMYRPLTMDRGDLVGMCSVCGCRQFRRVSLAKLSASLGGLMVCSTDADGHIGESRHPSLNCDFNKETVTHG